MRTSFTPNPLLVLLPGLDGTGTLFRNFVAALKPGIDTQIVTYPLDQRLGYAALEARVRAALPAGRPFVVLGESFSGPIAIRIAADPPANLAGLILTVSFAKNPYPRLAWTRPLITALPVMSMPRWVRSLLLRRPIASSRVPDEAKQALAQVDERVRRLRIAEMLAVDATASLARVTLPLLVVQASADAVVPAAATDLMLRVNPRAQHVTIDGPHLLLQTNAAPCAAAIGGFLEQACHA
jgi:pimeloyl-ACP methyl ester carboxylesterase